MREGGDIGRSGNRIERIEQHGHRAKCRGNPRPRRTHSQQHKFGQLRAGARPIAEKDFCIRLSTLTFVLFKDGPSLDPNVAL